MMILRLLISYMVYHYRFLFAPGEDGKAIIDEAQNHLVLTAGRCIWGLKRGTIRGDVDGSSGS